MKSLNEILTPEQKELFKNWYVWYEDGLSKLVYNESDELTPENFRVLYITEKSIEKGCEVATVDDIKFYEPETKDFDFYIGGDNGFFYRDEAPEEVVEFLDRVLNKAQYEAE